MSSLRMLNPNSEIAGRDMALAMNINAGQGLQNVLKSNLGPKGTMKMLVSGGGDIKLTKDGSVLLHEMQIQHPTAALIARSATAQDDVVGDGTTSNVLIIGELLKQAARYLAEKLHPRIITEGFDLARVRALEFLEKSKVEKDTTDRELLTSVARTSLRTKVPQKVADLLTEIVVDAVLTIRRPEQPIDLHMIEVMTMPHRSTTDSRLVKGLVLDHGGRHPDMPKRLENCYILICNVSLEFDKPELKATVSYSNAAQREKLVEAEHKITDMRTRQIIELKRKVCDGNDKSFVVINQKGIDPLALDMFAKEGILALRRAKRRNMERLTLACGGVQVNTLDDLDASVLGSAGLVYEMTLGEEKFTFVEKVENPFSCTILIKGPNQHTILQVKDACRDGIRAVKNALDDRCVLPGGGAFEIALHDHLVKYKEEVKGRAKVGVQAFADAMLVIPKTLAENSGFDQQDCLIALQEGLAAGHTVGLDLETGEPMDAEVEGVWDNYRVKRQMLHSATVIATQILLVDEIMKAGKSQNQQPQQ
ncbi:T-complex protein 1 subunit zeta [Balamuthia mandrillaris]